LRLVADSFAWPFRGRWRSSWAVGLPAVLLSPLLFIPLLGYAVEATRAAEQDPSQGPPPWRLSDRLIADGVWLMFAIAITEVPYVLFRPLTGALRAARVWQSNDSLLSSVHVYVVAFFVLALPWGILALLFLPHATARFAASGRARDMFDFIASIRGVRRDFAVWNVAVAAIVTAWAVGLACAGLFCIGLVPGIYYAILVSAHASATLKPANPSSR
jgi:uncharacterized protein DUF4013